MEGTTSLTEQPGMLAGVLAGMEAKGPITAQGQESKAVGPRLK